MSENEDFIENPDGTYDYNGQFDLSVHSYLIDKTGKLRIKFNTINGYCNFSWGGLTSLEGSPTTVNGDFSCSDNTELESLEYCPTTIKGDFSCSRNELESLEYCPTTVIGNFICNSNKNLESLEFCPTTVTGYFYCTENKKQFTEEEVRAKCTVGGKVYV